MRIVALKQVNRPGALPFFYYLFFANYTKRLRGNYALYGPYRGGVEMGQR